MNFKEFWDKLADEIAKDEDMDYNTFKRVEKDLNAWVVQEKHSNSKSTDVWDKKVNNIELFELEKLCIDKMRSKGLKIKAVPIVLDKLSGYCGLSGSPIIIDEQYFKRAMELVGGEAKKSKPLRNAIIHELLHNYLDDHIKECGHTKHHCSCFRWLAKQFSLDSVGDYTFQWVWQCNCGRWRKSTHRPKQNATFVCDCGNVVRNAQRIKIAQPTWIKKYWKTEKLIK